MYLPVHSVFSFFSVSFFQPSTFGLLSFFLMSVHHTQLLLSRSSIKQQSRFQRAFLQSTAPHVTTDESLLWRFGCIFAVNGTHAPIPLGVSVDISFYVLFYVLSLNTSLGILLASSAAATFQHGILTQLACTETTVTLLRSLQYGSRFGFRSLFAYQDQTRGWVLVQLYSGNVVFLGPLSLKEYQMHRVQCFNIQGRIYTYVNYTLQFSSEPMRQPSMQLPMTNLSTHRSDYVASTALYSEASSRQRPYFSVLEQVAQAYVRLQQQLRLFLYDEVSPFVNTSLTSANFNVITQKIGNIFPVVSFFYFCLLPNRSQTSFWPFWNSSPIFGPYVYSTLLCAICVAVSALMPELFEFGQPTIFVSYVTVSHIVSHARHHGRPQGGAKRAFAPPWKLGLRGKIFWNRWDQQFNSD